MQYPHDFCARTLALFAGDPLEVKVRELLEQGDTVVGRLLVHLSDFKWSPSRVLEVLEADDESRTLSLCSQLRRCVDASALYRDWSSLYHQQHPGMPSLASILDEHRAPIVLELADREG